MFLIRKFYRIKKLWEFMNKIVGIATAVGIAIIIGVIFFQINDTTYQVSSPEEYKKSVEMGNQSVRHVVHPDNPQILGPLQINKDKYLLGENIFVILKDLRPQDKGSVQFFTPEGILYDEMGFNGQERESQKKYFKPGLLKSKSLCEKEQLVGTWTVMFKDYDMAKIYFEMLPDILPNQESHFVGCEIAYEIDITKPSQ
tara:strand:+ start:124 stop:720 length:597 start_codon:yes stop_codon:yes gene_type:complete